MKGKSFAHTLLAREFALDLGQAQYRPAIAEHLPGVANAICNVLSRQFQPGFQFKLPIQQKCQSSCPPKAAEIMVEDTDMGGTVTGTAMCSI